MRRTIATVLALLVTQTTLADVLLINVWDPHPGKAAATRAGFEISKTIHERAGAEVLVANDQMGNLHYIMRFRDFTHQNEVFNKLQDDEEWAKRAAVIFKEENATRVDVRTINLLSPSENRDGGVYESFVWQPETGQFSAMMTQAGEAKALHEKQGVDIEFGIDQLNRLVYILLYDDWEEYSKIKDNPSEEFLEWFNTRKGSSTLVQQFNGQVQ